MLRPMDLAFKGDDRRWSQLRVLDGGFGTELEASGFHINGNPLWSANALFQRPDLVVDIHKRQEMVFLSFDFVSSFHIKFRKSVDLAYQAAYECKLNYGKSAEIIGSVGSYATALSDASEYNGHYVDEVEKSVIVQHYVEQSSPLLEKGLRFLAYESVPAVAEVGAILSALDSLNPDVKCWISLTCKFYNMQHSRILSILVIMQPAAKEEWERQVYCGIASSTALKNFRKDIDVRLMCGNSPVELFYRPEKQSCRCTSIPPLLTSSPSPSTYIYLLGEVPRILDGEHTSHNDKVEEAAKVALSHSKVLAVGINCTSPLHISSLLKKIQPHLLTKFAVVYPNSGEEYNSSDNSWTAQNEEWITETNIRQWHQLGVKLVGGCCRVTPAMINTIARCVHQLLKS
ncbi:unnamed protein product [Enterobius vermicularis]|uniref:Hcy-binding domain-containing protein n=1 Tax=Enterobius vermicularis TaxID=51028 RepID=A0A0N4V0N3_ENTVE|nr:unnamed protein product [Enterobius vermicularis]